MKPGSGEEHPPNIVKLMKQQLAVLPVKIPEIRRFEIGINFLESPAAYDICLLSEFATREDLAAYQEHPEHKKVAQYIQSVTAGRVLVDYEV